ncbi:hypothetical protein D9615_004435 [Tricholomella constricta]|uniref:J domain-containing protein n=1 Tax=Tricholomella constricta TaxID=117010 RepID=A0A8H5HF46_9AGAR|nr:hypothetical protein D9615_004435 [Tricholomella constricta]
MDTKEPHELLGLPADATMGEIKQAYKQMALKWHPDRHIHDNTKDRAISMFAQVTNAYQLLMRDLDPPPATTKSKSHARPPTPVPSCRSSTGSTTSTSSNSPSRLSTSFHSDDSQTTLPSSFRGSETGPNFKPFNRYLDHSFDSPISISNEVSSQETNGSDMPEDTLRPNSPRTFPGRRHPACFANNNVQSVNAGWNARVGRLK